MKDFSGRGEEEGGSLFSTLQPRIVPVPAQSPVPAPKPESPQPPKPRAETPEPDAKAGRDPELFNFLRLRVSELEKKLFEVQEKAVTLSVELRAGEEARHRAASETEDMLRASRDSSRINEYERALREKIEKLEQLCEKLDTSSYFHGMNLQCRSEGEEAGKALTEIQAKLERLERSIKQNAERLDVAEEKWQKLPVDMESVKPMLSRAMLSALEITRVAKDTAVLEKTVKAGEEGLETARSAFGKIESLAAEMKTVSAGVAGALAALYDLSKRVAALEAIAPLLKSRTKSI